MPYSVFLSSTQKDLRPFREAVSRALKVDGHEVIEMERFGARSDVPLDVCLQEVVNAELFVGIYARRYGFVPRDSACSITEWEYREAKRLQRPCYCYFLREEIEWPEELSETGEAAAQLKRFKEQIQEDVAVDVFSTPEELVEKVRARLKAEVAEAAEEGSGERRFRRDFLNHIEHTCVDWLRQKVPAGKRLRIEREDCPQAVGKPERETAFPTGPTDAELRPAGVVDPIYDTFRGRSCRLLILGKPGGGKTIALFELCQSLLREARRDLDSRYPLVFNLSSWRWHDQRFETWVRREIEKKYGIGKKKARELVERDEIVPLLDGLDEVDPESRADCVKAINAYLTRREFTVLAVSCHSQVYDEIPGHAHLEGAVALRPLNPRQIDERLAAGGDPGLAAVREAVAADEELQKLAASPLMLILLERTYRGADPNAVREALGNPAADRRKKVLDEYVSRMLEPERDLPFARIEKDRGYRPEKTCRSLSWLAGRMRQHDSELLIEQIQPAWLPTQGHRLAYAVLSRALAGILLMAPLALFWGSELLFFGLLAGILAGTLDMPRLRRASAVGEEEKTPAQTVLLSLGRALLLGGGVSVLFLAVGWVGGAGQVSDLLMGGALFGPLFGLVLGTRSAGRDGSNDVRIRVKLRIGRWSWRASLWSAASLLLVSLAFWAISFLKPEIPYLTAFFWLFITALATLFGGLMGGALGALEDTPVPKRAFPNQGIRWTLLNAGVVALSVAALVGFSLGPLAMFVGDGDEQSRHNLVAVLEAAAVLGFWAGVWFSGLDFVQHYMLRLLLRAAGLLPLRLTHFLSYVTGRGLMQRTGGKYSFESQLLDHFASLPG